MASVLLYIGVALILIGWLSLAYFASKQLTAQRQYENLPLKWQEVKRVLTHRRNLSRLTVIIGLALILLSILL